MPEISELKDFTINPYENTQFEVVINSNPKPKVTWYRNEEVLSSDDHTQLIADIEAEIYRLAVSNITLVDAGTYKVVASNSLGEASRECKLTVHSKTADVQYFNGLRDISNFLDEAPQFVKPIEQQTVRAYGDVDFRVRYTAVPVASIKW
jgi:Immunoglobulin I-set domain